MLESLKDDPAALVVGGAWALWVIASHLLTTGRGARKDREVDSAAKVLNDGLQKALDSTRTELREERDRADRLAKVVQELSMEMGGIRSDLRHAQQEEVELKAEVLRANTTIEQLVLEARNKDKSITQLVDLNRKILRSIGSNAEALEVDVADAQEKPHGTEE